MWPVCEDCTVCKVYVVSAVCEVWPVCEECTVCKVCVVSVMYVVSAVCEDCTVCEGLSKHWTDPSMRAHGGQAHDGQAHGGQAHGGQAHDGQPGQGNVDDLETPSLEDTCWGRGGGRSLYIHEEICW